MRIALVGIDGSGKTTLLKRIQRDLESRGVRTKCTNLRGLHFRFLSLPMLLAFRLLGKEGRWFEGGQVKRSGHPALGQGCTWLKAMWTTLFLMDITLLAVIRGYFWIGTRVLLSDRNILDVLVDLMVAIGCEDLHQRKVVRTITRLLAADIAVHLDISAETAAERKPGEVKLDETLRKREELYKAVTDHFHIVSVDASRPFDEVYKEVWKLVQPKCIATT